MKKKITISRSQWETMGRKAGWIKKAQNDQLQPLDGVQKSPAAQVDLTWQEIQEKEDPGGKNHDLKLTCKKCGNSQTCRCSKPKREFSGICPDCQ